MFFFVLLCCCRRVSFFFLANWSKRQTPRTSCYCFSLKSRINRFTFDFDLHTRFVLNACHFIRHIRSWKHEKCIENGNATETRETWEARMNTRKKAPRQNKTKHFNCNINRHLQLFCILRFYFVSLECRVSPFHVRNVFISCMYHSLYIFSIIFCLIRWKKHSKQIGTNESNLRQLRLWPRTMIFTSSYLNSIILLFPFGMKFLVFKFYQIKLLWIHAKLYVALRWSDDPKCIQWKWANRNKERKIWAQQKGFDIVSNHSGYHVSVPCTLQMKAFSVFTVFTAMRMQFNNHFFFSYLPYVRVSLSFSFIFLVCLISKSQAHCSCSEWQYI